MVSTKPANGLHPTGFGMSGPDRDDMDTRRTDRGASSPAMSPIPEPAGAEPAPECGQRKNPLSPKKLLLTKWTAVTPRNREKHFVVLRVIEPEPPSVRIEQVELQAVHSGNLYLLHWRELTDASQWRQGWV